MTESAPGLGFAADNIQIQKARIVHNYEHEPTTKTTKPMLTDQATTTLLTTSAGWRPSQMLGNSLF